MTFVYTLKDVIGLVALGVGVAGLLLLIVIARIADKLAERRKKREERHRKETTGEIRQGRTGKGKR